jgi:4,5-dihydroxyphthalate decarboxylase
MGKLRLTLACWDYDRTRALADGRIVPEGIDLVYLTQPVEETFFRMMRFREFDCAEMSLSSYTASLNSANPPFIAIPAFPSRYFRHSCTVSAKSGIAKPADLSKRIGVPEYQMTARGSAASCPTNTASRSPTSSTSPAARKSPGGSTN